MAQRWIVVSREHGRPSIVYCGPFATRPLALQWGEEHYEKMMGYKPDWAVQPLYAPADRP
jgi:hypothetical protein